MEMPTLENCNEILFIDFVRVVTKISQLPPELLAARSHANHNYLMQAVTEVDIRVLLVTVGTSAYSSRSRAMQFAQSHFEFLKGNKFGIGREKRLKLKCVFDRAPTATLSNAEKSIIRRGIL